MFIPGSKFVGRVVEAFLSVEFWPWGGDLQWDDHDRQGVGSFAIIGLTLAAAGFALWWLVFK